MKHGWNKSGLLLHQPKSILQMNNIFWRGRSFSSLQQGWFTDSSQCVMRLYTENYLTIIHHNRCPVAHHWNEDKNATRRAAWVWQADAGEELTAKVDLLHNQTGHKERRQLRFELWRQQTSFFWHKFWWRENVASWRTATNCWIWWLKKTSCLNFKV